MLATGRYIVLGKKQKGDEYILIASREDGEIVARKRHSFLVSKTEYEKHKRGETIMVEITIKG